MKSGLRSDCFQQCRHTSGTEQSVPGADLLGEGDQRGLACGRKLVEGPADEAGKRSPSDEPLARLFQRGEQGEPIFRRADVYTDDAPSMIAGISAEISASRIVSP